MDRFAVMNTSSDGTILSLSQTIGLLQRFMPQRNASKWLENDRCFSPILPFLRQSDAIFYLEDDLVRFVHKIVTLAVLRTTGRRQKNNRRVFDEGRRNDYERRRLRRKGSADDLDRRSAICLDRRSELDRRLRGWIDRRGTDDRRTLR